MIKVTPAIEASGYGVSGDIGGLPRKTYYTPDGRVIQKIPSMRHYSIIDKGVVIKSGIRDANLDRGWLLQKPTELKLYCAGCDMWHDTQKEVDACIIKKDKKVGALGKKAIRQNGDDMDALKKEVAELKEMLAKVLEAK